MKSEGLKGGREEQLGKAGKARQNRYGRTGHGRTGYGRTGYGRTGNGRHRAWQDSAWQHPCVYQSKAKVAGREK
jgi:hypothetical protein